MPRDPPCSYHTSDAFDFLSRTKLGKKEYLYSNFAFGLLGLLLERHSGTPYTQLCHELLFEPLHMDDTAVRHALFVLCCSCQFDPLNSLPTTCRSSTALR